MCLLAIIISSIVCTEKLVWVIVGDTCLLGREGRGCRWGWGWPVRGRGWAWLRLATSRALSSIRRDVLCSFIALLCCFARIGTRTAIMGLFSTSFFNYFYYGFI